MYEVRKAILFAIMIALALPGCATAPVNDEEKSEVHPAVWVIAGLAVGGAIAIAASDSGGGGGQDCYIAIHGTDSQRICR